MKRSCTAVLMVLMASVCVCLLAACTPKAEVPNKVVGSVGQATSGSGQSTATDNAASSDTSGDLVAFVCESGDVKSSSFNAQIWDGIQKFAKSQSDYRCANYPMVGDATSDAVGASMQQAISDGAKVVVCVGQSGSQAVSSAAAAHPDVAFLLMDAGVSGNVPSNVHCVTFDNVQAGYLAGYALVAEGYRGLGFVGGQNVASVSEYGFGFIQGANDAAVRQQVTDDMYLAYWYTGTFTPNASIQTEAARWFTNGVDVEFSCAGSVQDNVIAAAEGAGKVCVVADGDASNASKTVLFAAVKNLSGATSDALSALAKNKGAWAADESGTTVKLGVAEGGVSLSSDAGWRMKTFSQAKYDELVASMKNGQVKVNEDTSSHLDIAIQVDMK